jgi:hypothetical protein
MSYLIAVGAYGVGCLIGWFARAYWAKQQAASPTEKPQGGGGPGEE